MNLPSIKYVYLNGRVISNILSTKEQEKFNRPNPKYGTVIISLSQVNNYSLPESDRHQGESRAIVEISYLTHHFSADPNYQLLEKLNVDQELYLKVDPYAFFTKPGYQVFQRNGYMNYSLKVFGSQENCPEMSLKPLETLAPDKAIEYIQSFAQSSNPQPIFISGLRTKNKTKVKTKAKLLKLALG